MFELKNQRTKQHKSALSRVVNSNSSFTLLCIYNSFLVCPETYTFLEELLKVFLSISINY